MSEKALVVRISPVTERALELVARMEEGSQEDIARDAISLYCHRYLSCHENINWEWIRTGGK